MIFIFSVQAYLVNTARSVTDHYNKVNRGIKRVTQNFCLSNAYKSYIYTILWSIKCEIVLGLKKYTPLLKNPLLLKNAVI